MLCMGFEGIVVEDIQCTRYPRSTVEQISFPAPILEIGEDAGRRRASKCLSGHVLPPAIDCLAHYGVT